MSSMEQVFFTTAFAPGGEWQAARLAATILSAGLSLEPIIRIKEI
jgi:ABC-type cobalamin transport system ATPase subunit